MAEGSQAKPIEDVRDISAITYGFMASKALFTALDLDLFTHIERGTGNLIGLAKATGLSENLLLTLLTALKSLGLIVEHWPVRERSGDSEISGGGRAGRLPGLRGPGERHLRL